MKSVVVKAKIISLVAGVLLVSSIHAQENESTEESLSLMNRVDMDLYVDLTNDVQGKDLHILLIGNSITLHGKAPDIGWSGEYGMAASSMEKDYAHRLFRMLEKLMPERRIHMRLANSAAFERGSESYDLNLVDQVKEDFAPDFILFQLGENVPYETDMESFKRSYVAFIHRYRQGNQATTLCTTPFFPNARTSEAIKAVALQSGSFLVDLGSLVLLDEQNYAKNETDYPGNRDNWKVEGIGIHPGDYGMENIAGRIFVTIQAFIRNSN
ncbi:MAG: SGNH/GDSL hydrolase family protein [Bacteroidota bacterium]